MKIDTDEEAKPPRKAGVSHSASVEYTFVAKAEVRQGERDLGDTDAQFFGLNYVSSVPVHKNWQIRAGVNWDRFSFGNTPNAPLPDTLQSTALVLGVDAVLSEKWLMRLDFQPGIYSDFEDISSDDFHVPILLGFSYFVDSRLQWIFGAGIGFFNDIPVFPAVGVRWQFDDDWTLNGILPKPNLVYRINEQLSASVGGELKGGSFRMSEDFGTIVGNPALNNAIISYMEIRAGAGLVYQFHPAVALEADAGYMVYRRFDYFRAETTMRGDPAPYAQLGLKAKF
ncbi:MAG: hypothetical protein HC904_10430 [Blastochloris sp.]|nr:hypothetical protein [Blastochloris sp.]